MATPLPSTTFVLLFLLISSTFAADTPTCPLDFTIARPFLPSSSTTPTTPYLCQLTLSLLHLVLASHLRSTSLFLPPPPSSPSCWLSLTLLLNSTFPSFDPRRDCAFPTPSISQGCMNISSLQAFRAAVPSSVLSDAKGRCDQDLRNGAPCTLCTTALSRIKAAYLPGPDIDGNNVTHCASYPSIFAAAVLSSRDPADPGTASCLFLLGLPSSPPNSGSPSSSSSSKRWIYAVVPVVAFLIVSSATVALCFVVRKRRRKRKRTAASPTALQLESIETHTTLIRYRLEDIRAATGNFSRDNIIGKGGYGNVYKGLLPLQDGGGTAEVAVKRFKNCSAAGNAGFAHEVEALASVRHVNLVALRGYCIAAPTAEGAHQRMIICDLVRNGSLHDHLFGLMAAAEGQPKLSWPVRRRIAVGTARGLAYLHHGAQPGIIHRDIKASNVLLDEDFEPKVADFGLAKFAPEGASHLSTRVAGTLGYVAPEYALYGKLTEKSDVYSFGVLLLELLSGKKAVMSSSTGESQTLLLSDWAWSLVRRGKAVDVLEDGMEGLEAEVVEKFVLIGVICSHPQMPVRPTMDQVLKMMETSMPVPPIPDRPISLLSDMNDIERSVGSSGSGQLSTFAGYQPFTLGDESNDRFSSNTDREGAETER